MFYFKLIKNTFFVINIKRQIGYVLGASPTVCTCVIFASPLWKIQSVKPASHQICLLEFHMCLASCTINIVVLQIHRDRKKAHIFISIVETLLKESNSILTLKKCAVLAEEPLLNPNLLLPANHPWI